MRYAGFLVVILAGGLLTQPAWADRYGRRGPPTDNPQHERAPRDNHPQIGPGEAASIARQQNGGGQVLSVNLSADGGHYRVKLLKNGEVNVIVVPAR